MENEKIIESPEAEKWIESVEADSTKSHYRMALRRFCEFHNTTPTELIEEVHKAKETKDTEKPWRKKRTPADDRLQQWHAHLVDEKGISRTSAQLYWRCVRAFYEFWIGDSVTADTPSAPDRENELPDYNAEDVKKMLTAAVSPRNRAIILCSFQGGMDPQEIVRLNYGDVKYELENDEDEIIFIHKSRKKTGVTHHTFLLRDAIDELRTYINRRKKEHGEISEDDPLFATNGGKEMQVQYIQKMMRRIRDRVADQIPEAQKVKTKNVNPLSLKYLRRAFSNQCRAAKVDKVYREYWMGHSEPYNGAYSGQLPKEEQKKQIFEETDLYRRLSITAPKQIEKEQAKLREEQRNLKDRMERQQKIIGSQKSTIDELEDEIEELKTVVGDKEEFFRRFDEYKARLDEFNQMKKEIMILKKAAMMALSEEEFDKIVEKIEEASEEIEKAKDIEST